SSPPRSCGPACPTRGRRRASGSPSLGYPARPAGLRSTTATAATPPRLAGVPARAGVDLVARATDLRDLAMPLARCADAFTRVNAKLVPQPPAGTPVEFEAELPGTLDGLVAFAVASVTREQEASQLS